ncbi:Rv3235 family protein [Rothia halotolerans]|uniref:Rv3235 family protein n=1 Tax=Rothia halotolerans TaxID=405770 RepID=UPI00101D48B8|nr:Rv3235 family protein [Rothia halotolerans]
MSTVPEDPRVRLRRGTVLSIESIPAAPGTHPAGPPPYYRWRRRSTDPEEQLRRVHAIAATMGVALVEVVTGGRSADQLARWVHPRALARLRLRAGIEGAREGARAGRPPGTPATGRGPGRRDLGAPGPGRSGAGVPGPASPAPGRFGPRDARLRRVRAILVAPDEYEASVAVDDGERTRAIALRIHKPRGQWQVVEAEIG